jgi:hypothetical protein
MMASKKKKRVISRSERNKVISGADKLIAEAKSKMKKKAKKKPSKKKGY